MTEQQKEVGDWAKGVKVNTGLPGGKGTVKAIHEPKPIKTKFGDRFASQIVIDGTDGSTINVQLFLPQQFPLVHPKSGLARIMKHYGCIELLDLLGKEVEVLEVGDMLWKIKVD